MNWFQQISDRWCNRDMKYRYAIATLDCLIQRHMEEKKYYDLLDRIRNIVDSMSQGCELKSVEMSHRLKYWLYRLSPKGFQYDDVLCYRDYDRDKPITFHYCPGLGVEFATNEELRRHIAINGILPEACR